MPATSPSRTSSLRTAGSRGDLAWTKTTGATRYRISYGIGDGARSRIDIGNVAYHRLTGLTSGSTYTIDMAAFLPDGTKSAYSPRINVTTD